MTALYQNDNGIGGRSGRTLTASTTFTFTGTGGANALFDGDQTNSSTFGLQLNVAQTVGMWKIDFGVGVLKRITEVRLIMESSTAWGGTWIFQGSNDNSNWDDLTASIAQGGAVVNTYPITLNTSNFYRYFRMVLQSGTVITTVVAKEYELCIEDFNGEPARTPNYSNPMGKGNRSRVLTCVVTGLSGTWGTVLVNGSKSTANGPIPAVVTTPGKNIDFDFTRPVNITEVTWYTNLAIDSGVWKFQYSDDNITYTDYPASSFTLGGTPLVSGLGTNIITVLSGNTQAHRYLRLTGVSGSTGSGQRHIQYEFKIGTLSSNIVKDFIFDWAVDIGQDFIFDWAIVSGQIEQDFIFDWAIPFQKNFTFDWKIEYLIRKYYDVPEGDNISNLKIELAGPHTAVALPAPLIGTTPAIIPVEPPIDFDDIVSTFGSGFYYDFYERIWVSPKEFKLSNPRLNTPIMFDIWNAFHAPNTLNSYTYTDLIGVEVIDDAPIDFGEYERKELSFQITPDAPVRLDGRVTFNFDLGEGSFTLQAIIVEALRASPEIPITETWSWKTVVNIAYDSTEQRRALRLLPRTSTEFTIIIADEADRRYQYNYLSTFVSRNVQIPFYQYATQVSAPAVIGDELIKFNRAQTFIQGDEYISLFNPQTEETNLVKITTLNADGANLSLPLDFDIGATWLVVPLMDMRMPEGTGLSMMSIAGDVTISATSVNSRAILRAGSDIELTAFDGLPVLDKRPLADNDTAENFVTGVEVRDNTIAPANYYTAWPVPLINGNREYKVNRLTEMDYWRTFATEVNGMQKPFLLPTFRQDLPVVGIVELGANQFDTSNLEYANYFANDTYKRIQIATANGIIYRKVISATQAGGVVTVILETALGLATGDNVLGYISYLNKVRLDSDVIELQHLETETFLKLTVRNIEA